MHAAWDLPQPFWGSPIWPFMRTSSFGCAIFDTLIAVWFLARGTQAYRASPINVRPAEFAPNPWSIYWQFGNLSEASQVSKANDPSTG
jgi:Family of unknown function (DUF6010)